MPTQSSPDVEPIPKVLLDLARSSRDRLLNLRRSRTSRLMLEEFVPDDYDGEFPLIWPE